MKRQISLLVMALLAAVLAGCGSAPAADMSTEPAYAVITDDMGRTVRLPKKPERIVVTSASFLEPLEAVDGADLVVGRPDSKTKMPAYAKDLPSVGKVYQADTEKIIACNPDLVIVNKGMNEKLVDTLESNGIKTLVLDMKSYEDVKREVGILAQVTGAGEKGEALIADMDARIQAVRDKIPQDKRRVSIIHSTSQGLSVQLDGSIGGSVANMLGWTNVAAGTAPLENNPDAAPYSLETLVDQDPELIFVTSMGKLAAIKAEMDEAMKTNPAWQSVTAVKQGRVYYLPQDLFLLSPGIHYPKAVETMAKCVYPEVFK